MAIVLTEKANERSTFVITAALTDENGDAVTPNVIAWSLTDIAGNIINTRDSVALTPASSVNIVLHGDDLAIGSIGAERKVTLEGTYDSTLGSALEITDEVTFYIVPLVGIAD